MATKKAPAPEKPAQEAEKPKADAPAKETPAHVTPEPSASDYLKLSAKLLEVFKHIGRVEKRGENKFHHYKYVTESDLVDEVRHLLTERNLLPSCTVISTNRYPKGDGFLTDVMVEWTFMDVDTGATMKSLIPGCGEDKGDKGVYKAMTGSEKYWLMKTFLIPTGDDPEEDATTVPGRSNRPAGARQEPPKQEPKREPKNDSKAPEPQYEVSGKVVETGKKDAWWFIKLVNDDGGFTLITKEEAIGSGLATFEKDEMVTAEVDEVKGKVGTYLIRTIQTLDA